MRSRDQRHAPGHAQGRCAYELTRQELFIGCLSFPQYDVRYRALPQRYRPGQGAMAARQAPEENRDGASRTARVEQRESNSASRTARVEQRKAMRAGVALRACDETRACPGYTLFAPMSGDGTVYLIDLHGAVVHTWRMPWSPGLYGHLTPAGTLFYCGKTSESSERFISTLPFKGGAVLEANWRRIPCSRHSGIARKRSPARSGPHTNEMIIRRLPTENGCPSRL